MFGAATEATVVLGAYTSLTDYYRSYITVGIYLLAAFVMVAAILGAGKLIRPNRPQPDKYIAYEAGSDPIGTFGQSNVRYYIFALLFVIFDVEAMFVFPWAMEVDSLGWFGFGAMSMFILVLLLGLFYDWRKGLLKWT
jgi:NADH-quinone oxidoreductase subunit A